MDGIKADNPDDLNLNTSWVGGSLPDSFGVALFGSAIAADQSYALGSSLSWGGISLTNPGGPQAITGAPGQILALGSSGISMSTATANLTVQADVALTATQLWTVGSGRTLSVSGAISGDLGTTLSKAGPGALILSGASTFAGNVNVTEGNLVGSPGTELEFAL